MVDESQPSGNWKAIAGFAAALGIFFTIISGAQYWYAQYEIYDATFQQLTTNAERAESTVRGRTTAGHIDPSLLDKASFDAPNYIILSSDGLLELVYSADRSNRVPGGIITEVTPPSGDFSTPKSYQSPAGDMWTLYTVKMSGGYVILGTSATSDVADPRAMLVANAAHFKSENGVITANTSDIDNVVDYAIVDSSNTVTYAAGYVPLKTNLPAVQMKLAAFKDTTPFRYVWQDVTSLDGAHIGVAIVWADLTKEQAVLTHELFFFVAVAFFSWLVALTGLLRYRSRSETAKRDLRRAFQKYVSPQVMDTILKDPKKVELGGQRREVTILFSDIRDFTTVTEQLPPQKLTKLLQEYFDAMTEEIVATQGVLDKFIGDAIMAFWGAPIDQPDQADRAVTTAINMMKRLKLLQEEWAAEGSPVLDIGIGINLGVAAVGNFGSHQRFDYTLIGDSVNAASRIEGVNKELDSHILISESTLQQLTISINKKDRGNVRVKGREQEIHLYEVFP